MMVTRATAVRVTRTKSGAAEDTTLAAGSGGKNICQKHLYLTAQGVK